MRSFAISSRPAELPWLEFELPAPPSVNRFMGKLGNKTPKVRLWIIQADMSFMLLKSKRGGPVPELKCTYEAEFWFARNRGDLDNKIKPLMDYLQRIQVIENDRMCERLLVQWSDDVPKCRVMVRLRPWMERK
jgi:hypothetical protein